MLIKNILKKKRGNIMRKSIKKIILMCTIVTSMFANNVYAASTDSTSNSMKNEFLDLSVDDNEDSMDYCRFNLKTAEGCITSKEDDNSNLLYENFYTGLTTIFIGDEGYVYGKGKSVKSPYYDKKEESNISVQKFNEIKVEQKLKFVKGFTDEYDDMLEIKYVVSNEGKNESNVGLRIMIDPFLSYDDGGVLQVGDKSITNESEFNSNEIGESWSIKSEKTGIEAYGKITDDSFNSLQFANWDELFNEKWNYEVSNLEYVEDSAVAMNWVPTSIKPGESKTFTMVYGVKNTKNIVTDDETEVEIKEETITNNTGNTTKSGDYQNIILISVCSLVSLVAVIFLLKKGGREC